MGSAGGIYLNNNATGQALTGQTPTKVSAGTWAAFGLGHGDLTVAEDAVNARLLLKPGTYRVEYSATVEGLAADGILTFQLYKNGYLVNAVNVFPGGASGLDKSASWESRVRSSIRRPFPVRHRRCLAWAT